MVDGISVAGLTIAIFDELLKLAQNTAELVNDIRSFDEVSTELHDKIIDEGNKTSILGQLLFQKAAIYQGQTLFDQFEEDVQVQIKILLNQLKAILLEGFDLVHRRYRSSSSVDKSRSISTSTLSSIDKSRGSSSFMSLSSVEKARGPSPIMSLASVDKAHGSPSVMSKSSGFWSVTPSVTTERKGATSPLLLLRWSFRDKKRVEAIIANFRDMNGRISDQVKLWCLASQLGVDLQHLKYLQTDVNSKRLGFDVDATLRLTACDADSVPGTLELQDHAWQELLQEEESFNECFSTTEVNGRTLLLEKFAYDIDSSVSTSSMSSLCLDEHSIDSRTRNRVDALAKLLNQPKELVFRIPSCIGWKYSKIQKSITFVFDVKARLDSPPISLLGLLNDATVKPSLGDKFRLAHGLANCISQLHMVQWVHESFRSENILFFPSGSSDQKVPDESVNKVNYSQPWVLGFEFSRPENFFSAGLADFCAARDVYRHPERQGRPEVMFNKMHDIYALGVVLLEIGLWEPALTLEKHKFERVKNPRAVREQLMKHANSRLASRVGEKYKNVVLKCLSGQFSVVDDTKEELKLQQAFRSQVVDVLEAAAEAV